MINENRIIFHPGTYIKDAIDELGLNQSEFALRSGLSIKNVSTLISGESNITFDVAVKLASFFDNSVQGWINLQVKYDLYKSIKAKEKQYEEDWKIAKLFDRYFINNYLNIPFDSKNKKETIDQLRKAFRVGYLTTLKQPNMYVFYHTSISKDINERNIIMRNAWTSIAEEKAKTISANEFNKEKLLNNIELIKHMTLENPKVFVKKLEDTLKECGIKLVILPYLSNSNVSGVTKWLAYDNTVLIAVNDCGKDADKMWFAIFHEIGHAIKNHKRHLTISLVKGEEESEEEIEANNFAKNSLINPSNYKSFIDKGNFSKRAIIEFAKNEGVAPFVVLGRLQKDGFLPWGAFNELKVQYKSLY